MTHFRFLFSIIKNNSTAKGGNKHLNVEISTSWIRCFLRSFTWRYYKSDCNGIVYETLLDMWMLC